MKIRTQFFLLIGGIVVVPLFVSVGFFLAQRLRESSAPQVPDYGAISRLAGESVDQASWEKLSRFLEHKPPTIEFSVLDRNMLVLFSTIRENSAGAVLSDESLLSLIRRTSGDYLYQLDSPVRTGEGGLLLLTRVSRSGRRPPRPFETLFVTMVIILGSLLVFSAIMSITIARSITQSVLVLEEATRRIAAGELDFPIDARGSNEITSLAASLTSMRDSLREDQARRSRFIMGVTHDLKTPLSLIKGYAEAIGDGLADEPDTRDHYVGIIGAKVDQLDGMVDDLIDFVRMNTAEWRSCLKPVALAPFLRDFSRRVTEDALILNHALETDLAIPEGIEIPMDERLVVRALENLVNNALRYTPSGGRVRLAARVERGRAILRISDNGQGIDEKDLPRIFDAFYRGTGSRREQGMGLGLSIVQGVVDSHGWDISVSSRRGAGSAFVVSIPLQEGESGG